MRIGLDLAGPPEKLPVELGDRTGDCDRQLCLQGSRRRKRPPIYDALPSIISQRDDGDRLLLTVDLTRVPETFSGARNSETRGCEFRRIGTRFIRAQNISEPR